ncbi:MAG: N-acetylmuramoyl-L-alanine amidase [Peptostreptococcaceae bacterium]
MKINLHAGHNPDGQIACGAVGLIKESTEARLVVSHMIDYLEKEGVIVYDCTVNDGTSSGDVLRKIIALTDKHSVDLDVSIHFNAGASDTDGNGQTTGTETLIYSTTSSSSTTAQYICDKISSLGFKNRGIKVRSDLYFLKKTAAPAVLVECCFVDDKDDVLLYDSEKMAKAICEGILGKTLSTDVINPVSSDALYGVMVFDFSTEENANTFSTTLTNKENAYNTVEKLNTTWCIKVSHFSTEESANAFSQKLKDTYNAYNTVYKD